MNLDGANPSISSVAENTGLGSFNPSAEVPANVMSIRHQRNLCAPSLCNNDAQIGSSIPVFEPLITERFQRAVATRASLAQRQRKIGVRTAIRFRRAHMDGDVGCRHSLRRTRTHNVRPAGVRVWYDYIRRLLLGASFKMYPYTCTCTPVDPRRTAPSSSLSASLIAMDEALAGRSRIWDGVLGMPGTYGGGRLVRPLGKVVHVSYFPKMGSSLIGMSDHQP